MYDSYGNYSIVLNVFNRLRRYLKECLREEFYKIQFMEIDTNINTIYLQFYNSTQ